MRWRHRERKFSAPSMNPVALILLATVLRFALEANSFSYSGRSNAVSLAIANASQRSRLWMGNDQSFGNQTKKKGLKIAIVGAGPSGLLLSNLLMKGDDQSIPLEINLFDFRSDPRANEIEGRAYALGIGVRGRTAIRRLDPDFWEAVKLKGFESERFNLHLGISKKRDLIIPLRSDSNKKSSKKHVEPSLLIYQLELCKALLDKLEELHQREKKKNSTNKDLKVRFDTKVADCNLDTMIIRTTTNAAPSITEDLGPFDLIVGCDGVNSRVRDAIDRRFKEFETTTEPLPGFLKVVRLDYSVGQTAELGKRAPYDPKAVKLLLPSGAFITPLGADGSCCILFSARGSDFAGEDSTNESLNLPLYLTETQNTTAVVEALQERFPRWKEEAFPDIAKQLMAQDLRGNSASKVTCNTYHYQNKAVIVGDAAHSTGGVSGQGLNSALMDVLVLDECLQQQMQNQSFDLEASLVEYSMRQVPEGKALYELFFGPNPQGKRKKFLWGLKKIRDALFQGKLGIGEDTLRTRLSSDLTPFANIRRDRDYFYKRKNGSSGKDDGSFPSEDELRAQLDELHQASYL